MARRSGFTLIELLVGIGLMLVLMTLFATTLTDAHNTLLIEQTRQELFDETSRAMTTLVQFGETANGILSTYTAPDTTTYTTSETLVILTVPARDTNDVLTGTNDTIVIGISPSISEHFIVGTFPGAGSSRTESFRTLSEHMTSLVVRYFVPDGSDADSNEEALGSTSDYPTATRIEGTITSSTTVSDTPVTLSQMGSARLRNK